MNLISLLLIILVALGCTLLFNTKSFISFILILYVFINATIVGSGYITSWIGHFSSIHYWILVELLAAIILCFKFFISKQKLIFPQFPFSKYNLNISFLNKLIICLLGLTIGTVLLLNFITIIYSSPNNADTLTYHLARVAYYLQHDTMKWFPTNQWPQVVHPKNSAITFAYIFLISNFNENLTQFPQYFAYIITILAVYGISIQLLLTKEMAIIASLLSGLPICLILESTTNQNDLLITSFAGCAIYFILSYKNTLKHNFLILFSFSVAIMTGYKASAIMIFPVLVFVVLYSFYRPNKPLLWKDLGLLILLTLFSSVIFTFPSGYFENYLVYGNLFGPDSMRMEHNFEGLSILEVVYQGSKNVVRYLANFCCFDGLVQGPQIIYDANTILWKGITFLLENIWPDIYSREYIRLPFSKLKRITSDEETVFFGAFGFLLVWPVTFWGLFSAIKKKSLLTLDVPIFLSISSIIFLISQSSFGQYDPWRGRMFGTMILFAGPLCGLWWDRLKTNIISKIFFLLVILISCWSAIWSILFRDESSWIIPNYTGKTLFHMNRMEQLMRDIPEVYEPFKKYDKIVPPFAKVESWLLGSYPEYVLFGEHLTRKIYTREESINGDLKSDYIIFDIKDFPPKNGDLILEQGYYLRKTH